MRHMKMAEWMENVEKSIARIMADKVYTSSEFKRERDTFNVSIPIVEGEIVTIILSLVSLQRSRESRGEKMALPDPGDPDG